MIGKHSTYYYNLILIYFRVYLVTKYYIPAGYEVRYKYGQGKGQQGMNVVIYHIGFNDWLVRSMVSRMSKLYDVLVEYYSLLLLEYKLHKTKGLVVDHIQPTKAFVCDKLVAINRGRSSCRNTPENVSLVIIKILQVDINTLDIWPVATVACPYLSQCIGASFNQLFFTGSKQ